MKKWPFNWTWKLKALCSNIIYFRSVSTKIFWCGTSVGWDVRFMTFSNYAGRREDFKFHKRRAFLGVLRSENPICTLHPPPFPKYGFSHPVFYLKPKWFLQLFCVVCDFFQQHLIFLDRSSNYDIIWINLLHSFALSILQNW